MLTCSVLGNLVWKIRCGIAARSRRRYSFPVRAGLPASAAFVLLDSRRNLLSRLQLLCCTPCMQRL